MVRGVVRDMVKNRRVRALVSGVKTYFVAWLVASLGVI